MGATFRVIILYSYLNASIGSLFAALIAGYVPKTTPTKKEKPNASRIDQRGTSASKLK
jgi:hypothetical protein